MTEVVQKLETAGFVRKWSMADVDAAVDAHVNEMAKSSFLLIGVAAIKFTVGVYVEGQKAADVGKWLIGKMSDLNYGKSSRYALANASLDVARALIKRLGQPDATERNAFWDMLEESATVSDAVAFMVAAIKSNFAVNTVADLTEALAKAKGKPKAEKSLADKLATALGDASSDLVADAVGTIIADHVNPSDLAGMIHRLAGKMTSDELAATVMALGDMLAIRRQVADAAAADKLVAADMASLAAAIAADMAAPMAAAA